MNEADKPAKKDSRRMWERVLTSVPHGFKVRMISVAGDGDKKAETLPDRPKESSEPPTPRPVGLE